MEVTEFFLKFFLIIVSAKAMAELFARFQAPSVIGEVAAGIIIGPSVLGIIEPGGTFLLLAEVGVLFLLFEVGMETDVTRLMAVGGQSAMVAVTGVVLPFASGFAVSRYGFGMTPVESLFVGGTLVATSIGITLRVFKDLDMHRTHQARVVLGAAVLDDVIGVLVLALLVDYTVTGALEIFSSFRTLVFMAVFLVAAPVLSSVLLRMLGKMLDAARTPGVVSTVVVALILILSVAAHELGAPEIVGAFAAGLALTGETCFAFCREGSGAGARVAAAAKEKMTPIGELFMPVFFVMVGASINFRAIDFGSSGFWFFACAMLLVAFAAKVLSGLWVKGPFVRKLIVGVAMVPRGEVGLIFAKAGQVNGIFDDNAYASMVFVVALTTLVAPFALKALSTSSPRQGASRASR